MGSEFFLYVPQRRHWALFNPYARAVLGLAAGAKLRTRDELYPRPSRRRQGWDITTWWETWRGTWRETVFSAVFKIQQPAPDRHVSPQDWDMRVSLRFTMESNGFPKES